MGTQNNGKMLKQLYGVQLPGDERNIQQIIVFARAVRFSY